MRKNRPWNEEKNSYRNVQTHSIKLLKSFCIHIQIKVHDGRREFAMGKEAKEKKSMEQLTGMFYGEISLKRKKRKTEGRRQEEKLNGKFN